MSDKPPLVLASSSAYRRAILARLGLKPACHAPGIDESPLPAEKPRALVTRLAEAKARAVATRVGPALIIGSDQVAVLEGRIIGKPRDHMDAVQQLRAASGKRTTLYCAVAVLNTGADRLQCAVEMVDVECRQLDDAEIERYLQQDQPYDCCGSLKVESLGIGLLKRITSDDPNAITGLPVIRLLEMLRAEGLSVP